MGSNESIQTLNVTAQETPQPLDERIGDTDFGDPWNDSGEKVNEMSTNIEEIILTQQDRQAQFSMNSGFGCEGIITPVNQEQLVVLGNQKNIFNLNNLKVVSQPISERKPSIKPSTSKAPLSRFYIKNDAEPNFKIHNTGITKVFNESF